MWSFDVYVIMVHIEIDLDKLSIYLSIYLSIQCFRIFFTDMRYGHEEKKRKKEKKNLL